MVNRRWGLHANWAVEGTRAQMHAGWNPKRAGTPIFPRLTLHRKTAPHRFRASMTLPAAAFNRVGAGAQGG